MSDRATDTGKGYQLRGRVVTVGGTETVGAKGFQKRMIVLDTEDDKYPQQVPFWFVQAQTAKLEGIFAGDDVTVTFDLNGREWSGKFFAELRGWKIEKHAGGNTCDQTTAPQTNPTTDAGKQEEALPF
jgi:hypothetical protein